MLLNLPTCTGKLKITPLHQPLYGGRNIHLVPVYLILILKLADTSDVPGSFCGLPSIFWIGSTLSKKFQSDRDRQLNRFMLSNSPKSAVDTAPGWRNGPLEVKVLFLFPREQVKRQVDWTFTYMASTDRCSATLWCVIQFIWQGVKGTRLCTLQIKSPEVQILNQVVSYWG